MVQTIGWAAAFAEKEPWCGDWHHSERVQLAGCGSRRAAFSCRLVACYLVQPGEGFLSNHACGLLWLLTDAERVEEAGGCEGQRLCRSSMAGVWGPSSLPFRDPNQGQSISRILFPSSSLATFLPITIFALPKQSARAVVEDLRRFPARAYIRKLFSPQRDFRPL